MSVLDELVLGASRKCYKIVNSNTTQSYILKWGLKPYIDKIHWMLLQRTIDEIQEVQIDGVETCFHINTSNEFSRVRNVRIEERPVLEQICKVMQEGDTFWDVGSCTGVFAVTIANMNPDSTVIAFEPYPPNKNSIRKNAELNGCDISIRPEALSNQAGTDIIQTQYTKGPGSQQATIDSDYASTPKAQDYEKVKLLPGDELIHNCISNPDVVKIDVEGHAPEVIDGMSEYLRPNKCRVAVVEPHNNSEELWGELESRGYNVTTIKLGGDRGQVDEPTLIGTAE